jgi:DNA mismatch repair ATPase MutS
MPVQARRIAHPLLEDAQRVPNDVTIPRQHPLLLVTGSNMAGKSTLLRALGLNLLLARTGAPICASAYEGELMELATSVRVQDSVQDGVSYFMAELHRLRQVVEASRRFQPSNGQSSQSRPVLALLDEILQGTNSRERQIAVLHVVEQLIETGAIIAMTTHDLELAGLSLIEQQGQVVHFREYFEMVDGQERMRFDYLMRPGPTPTTNALKLLEFVGLRTRT